MSKRQDAVHSKLTEKPLDSKKAIYAFWGGACVMGVFGGAAYLILHHAEASHEIVELASLTIMFFGAMITTLLTGVAAMDWKCISALQHMDETEDRHFAEMHQNEVESDQPIENLNVNDTPESEESAQETEVIVTGRRSPKDFLGNDLSL